MSELQTDVELETKKTSTNIRLRVKMKRTKKSPPTSESLLDAVPVITPISPPKIRSNYCRGIFMDKNDYHFSTVKPEVVADSIQEKKQPTRSDLDLPWVWTASSGHSSESGVNGVYYSATTVVPQNEHIIPYKNIYRNHKHLQSRVSLPQGLRKPGKLWGMSGMLVTKNFASSHLGISDKNNIVNGEKDDRYKPHSETDVNMLGSDPSIVRSVTVTGSDNIISHYGRCSLSSSSHTNSYKLSCSDVGIQPSSSASSFEDEEVVYDEIDFREFNLIGSSVSYISAPVDIAGAQTLSSLPLTLVPERDQSPICHNHKIAKCLHELHNGTEGRVLDVNMDDFYFCPETDESVDEFYSEDSSASSDEILPILDRRTRDFSWTNLILESEKPTSPTFDMMGSAIASDAKITNCVWEDSSDDQDLVDAVSRLEDLTINERAKASSASKIIVKSSLFDKKETTSDIGPIVHTKLPIIPCLQKSDMFNDAASFLLYNVAIPPKGNARRNEDETSSSTSNFDVIPPNESEDTSSLNDMAEPEMLQTDDLACMPQAGVASTSVCFLQLNSICEMEDAGQKLSEISTSSTPTEDYSTSLEDGMEAEFDIKEPTCVASSIHIVSFGHCVDECPEASVSKVNSVSPNGTDINVRATANDSPKIGVDEKSRLCTCLEDTEEGVSETTPFETNNSESSNTGNDQRIDAILRTDLALTAMSNDLSRSSSELEEGCEQNAKQLTSLQSVVNSSLNRLMRLAQALAEANDEEMKAHSHEMQMEIRHLESMVWRLKDEVEKLAFCLGKQDCKQELIRTMKLFDDMRKTRDELLQELLRARRLNLEFCTIITALCPGLITRVSSRSQHTEPVIDLRSGATEESSSMPQFAEDLGDLIIANVLRDSDESSSSSTRDTLTTTPTSSFLDSSTFFVGTRGESSSSDRSYILRQSGRDEPVEDGDDDDDDVSTNGPQSQTHSTIISGHETTISMSGTRLSQSIRHQATTSDNFSFLSHIQTISTFDTETTIPDSCSALPQRRTVTVDTPGTQISKTSTTLCQKRKITAESTTSESSSTFVRPHTTTPESSSSLSQGEDVLVCEDDTITPESTTLSQCKSIPFFESETSPLESDSSLSHCKATPISKAETTTPESSSSLSQGKAVNICEPVTTTPEFSSSLSQCKTTVVVEPETIVSESSSSLSKGKTTPVCKPKPTTPESSSSLSQGKAIHICEPITTTPEYSSSLPQCKAIVVVEPGTIVSESSSSLSKGKANPVCKPKPTTPESSSSLSQGKAIVVVEPEVIVSESSSSLSKGKNTPVCKPKPTTPESSSSLSQGKAIHICEPVTTTPEFSSSLSQCKTTVVVEPETVVSESSRSLSKGKATPVCKPKPTTPESSSSLSQGKGIHICEPITTTPEYSSSLPQCKAIVVVEPETIVSESSSSLSKGKTTPVCKPKPTTPECSSSLSQGKAIHVCQPVTTTPEFSSSLSQCKTTVVVEPETIVSESSNSLSKGKANPVWGPKPTTPVSSSSFSQLKATHICEPVTTTPEYSSSLSQCKAVVEPETIVSESSNSLSKGKANAVWEPNPTTPEFSSSLSQGKAIHICEPVTTTPEYSSSLSQCKAIVVEPETIVSESSSSLSKGKANPVWKPNTTKPEFSSSLSKDKAIHISEPVTTTPETTTPIAFVEPETSSLETSSSMFIVAEPQPATPDSSSTLWESITAVEPPVARHTPTCFVCRRETVATSEPKSPIPDTSNKLYQFVSAAEPQVVRPSTTCHVCQCETITADKPQAARPSTTCDVCHRHTITAVNPHPATHDTSSTLCQCVTDVEPQAARPSIICHVCQRKTSSAVNPQTAISKTYTALPQNETIIKRPPVSISEINFGLPHYQAAGNVRQASTSESSFGLSYSQTTVSDGPQTSTSDISIGRPFIETTVFRPQRPTSQKPTIGGGLQVNMGRTGTEMFQRSPVVVETGETSLSAAGHPYHTHEEGLGLLVEDCNACKTSQFTQTEIRRRPRNFVDYESMSPSSPTVLLCLPPCASPEPPRWWYSMCGLMFMVIFMGFLYSMMYHGSPLRLCALHVRWLISTLRTVGGEGINIGGFCPGGFTSSSCWPFTWLPIHRNHVLKPH